MLHGDVRNLRNDVNQRFAWLIVITVTSALAIIVVVGFFESISAHPIPR